MSFSEIFAIILGTIFGIFILLPVALFVFWILVLFLSPLLFIIIPFIFIWFIVWVFCKLFRLKNPFDLESSKRD